MAGGDSFLTGTPGSEECVANAREAIALYIEDLVASGEPVPEETAHPQVLQVTVAA